MRNISVSENYGFDTIICDYFYRSPFTTPSPTFTGARGAHKWHQGYIYLYYRVQKFISAIPKTMIRHYSSISFTCHPIQPSPIPLLRVSTFSISSPFDVTKLQKRNCLDVSSSHCLSVLNVNGHTFLSYIPYHPYGDGDSTWI